MVQLGIPELVPSHWVGLSIACGVVENVERSRDQSQSYGFTHFVSFLGSLV
jgi:hypothetical protein